MTERFDPRDLRHAVVAAPMAGGPSTPALAAAVGIAGGLGFLAAGYRSVDELAAQVAATRRLGAPVFGVNLFVPEPEPTREQLAAAEAYRRGLLPLAAERGVELPEPVYDDDAWEGKKALLLADPVPVVSCTFGLPDQSFVHDLQRVGTSVWATVTSPAEAGAALALDVDALVVQGPEAGGHRGTHDAAATPGTTPLLDLVAALVGRCAGVPLLAAGGIGSARAAQEARAVGADAVVAGTAFLLADEAGTSAVHRGALLGRRFATTALTRAFSGRTARGLANRFLREHEDAPAAYPLINRVTSPLRRAGAEARDADIVSLWAGENWREARPVSAAAVVATLSV